jgi:hypothetical protein
VPVILGFAAVAHVALVLGVVDARGALDHDEVISHLAATGHLDDWPSLGDTPPAGTWISGADAQQFLDTDSGSTPGEARSNLEDRDIHPPLWFWALLGAREAGLGVLWSGPVVNLVAVLVAGAVLFLLLRSALDDPLLAALGTAVFALTPALIRATGYARQYPVMMLAAVLLIWVTVRLRERPTSPVHLVAFAGVGTVGLLTGATFAFALAGAVVVIAMRWFRDLRAMVAVLGAAAASGLVTLAVFPGYPDQLSRARTIADSTRSSPVTRARDWAEGFGDLVTIESSVDRILLPVLLVGLLVVVATIPRWWRPVRDTIRSQPVAVVALGIGGTALLGATAAYVSSSTPAHARGWQYIVLFWPSIVLLGAVLLRNRSSAALTLFVVAALLGTYAWQWQRLWHDNFAAQRRAVDALADATLVVADCPMRGYTPGAAWWVPDNADFLLGARGSAPPPASPPVVDTTEAFLLHGERCRPPVDVAPVLRQLGLVRGERIGPVGSVQLYRLEA